MNPAQIVLVVVLTLVGVVVLLALLLLALSGGDTRRIGLFLRSGRILTDPALAGKVQPLLGPVEEKPPAPPRPSGAPLRLLRILQRDGRFLDFILENVQDYDDEQVATAVRSMQPLWQAAIREHLTLEPVRSEPEGTEIEVPPGFDPSAILLTGNVTGQPPFRGILKHQGWRVKEMKLNPPPEGQDEFVVMPAEVELPGAAPPGLPGAGPAGPA